MKKKESIRGQSRRQSAHVFFAFSKIRFVLILLILLLPSLVTPLLLTRSASALQGEKFKWIDSQTIQMYGGDVKAPALLKNDPVNNTGGDGYFYVSGLVTFKEGCSAYIDLYNSGSTRNHYDKGILSNTFHDPPPAKECSTDFLLNYSYQENIPIGNVAARSVPGTSPAAPPAPSDPANKQIIKVVNNTGWPTVYKDPTSNAHTAADMVPPNDVFVLCKGIDSYRNDVGTPDLEKWNKDCLAQKKEVFIVTTDGKMDSKSPVTYRGQFNNVTAGIYNVCSVINNGCEEITKEPGKIATADQFTGSPSQDADVSNGGKGKSHESNATCETGGFGLNWILCPVYNTVAGFCDFIFDKLVRPLLTVKPISTDPSTRIYKVWSNFRIYGDVFLVIALLVIVFGQSIGGGLVDAYTAKKALPRILAATILINLSIYIVAALVDLTNIVGGGLGQLITAPLSGAGAFNISPSGVQAGTIVGASAAGVGTAALAGLAAAASSTSIIPFVVLFVLLPAALGLIAAFVTLIIRQAIILGLVLLSPVAFALYCLPNTEKYFRKWWEHLSTALLVYPLVVLIFAISDLLSVTVADSTDGTVSGSLGMVMSFMLQFLPLLFIPYAFKVAGGAVGQLHGLAAGIGKRSSEAIKGNVNDPNSLRNRTKRNLGEAMTRGQASVVARGDKVDASRRTQARGKFAGMFGNVDQRLSTYNRLAAERRDQLVATGDDAAVYAGGGYKIGAGEAIPADMLPSLGIKDGSGAVASHDRFFSSKGEQISKPLYDRGQRFYGKTRSDKGQSLGYNLQKGINDKQKRNFRFAMSRNAKADNWNQDELDGTHATATYPHKGTNASEWYSKPKVVKNAQGQTTGVRYEDVGLHRGNYSGMIEDIHLAREGFKISQDRDADMRVMYEAQQKLETGLETGQIEDMDKDGNVVTRAFTDQDATDLARTYESFDAISQKMIAGRDEDSGSEYNASGTPAAQKIIKLAKEHRRGSLAQAADGSATVSVGAQSRVVKTAGDIDRGAFTG